LVIGNWELFGIWDLELRISQRAGDVPSFFRDIYLTLKPKAWIYMNKKLSILLIILVFTGVFSFAPSVTAGESLMPQEVQNTWTFVSMPDFLNVDTTYPQTGWEETLDYVLKSVRAENPDFVLVARVSAQSIVLELKELDIICKGEKLWQEGLIITII
jgi:hypothetical protein